MDLNEFLVGFFGPADVGDVRELPEHLQVPALAVLILRDADEEYQDISGYLDEIWEQEVHSRILKECPATDDGVDICEWIDQNIPVEEAGNPTRETIQ